MPITIIIIISYYASAGGVNKAPDNLPAVPSLRRAHLRDPRSIPLSLHQPPGSSSIFLCHEQIGKLILKQKFYSMHRRLKTWWRVGGVMSSEECCVNRARMELQHIERR